MSDLRTSRKISLDQTRGLAVLLMLGANLSPYALSAPRPLWYRAASTFCAPTFVLLFGFLLGQRIPKLRPSAWRAVRLLTIAALLDVVAWSVPPFSGFDILYFFGLSVPLLALLARLPTSAGALLIVAIGVAAPILRAAFPETEFPLPHGLGGPLHSALLSGWFPLLPWLGVALLGQVLAREQTRLQAVLPHWALGLALTTVGAWGWVATTPFLRERGGYAELFYPPDSFVLSVAVGTSLLAKSAFEALNGGPFRFLELLGRHSLLIYVVHILILGRVIRPLGLSPGFGTWGFEFLLLIVASWAVAQMKEHRSTRVNPSLARSRIKS